MIKIPKSIEISKLKSLSSNLTFLGLIWPLMGLGKKMKVPIIGAQLI
jgi:hypothetical protein